MDLILTSAKIELEIGLDSEGDQAFRFNVEADAGQYLAMIGALQVLQDRLSAELRGELRE